MSGEAGSGCWEGGGSSNGEIGEVGGEARWCFLYRFLDRRVQYPAPKNDRLGSGNPIFKHCWLGNFRGADLE